MAAGARASVLPKLRCLVGWMRLAPLVPPVVGVRPEMAGAVQASTGAGVSSLVRSGAGGKEKKEAEEREGSAVGPACHSLRESNPPGPAV
jgi:hypothetical protein